MTDLMIKTILRSDAKGKVTRKLIQAFLATPTIAFQSNRGNFNFDLEKLFDSLSQLGNNILVEKEITHTHLIKLKRSFRLLEIESQYLAIITNLYLKNSGFIQESSQKYFYYLAEFGDYINDLLESKKLEKKCREELRQNSSTIMKILLPKIEDAEERKKATLSL
jgi:hypothetical protein